MGIVDSSFTGNEANGAQLTLGGIETATVGIQGSRFADNNQNGLEFFAFEGSQLDLGIQNSEFTGNAWSGAELVTRDYEFTLARILDSVLSNNGMEGLYVENFDNLTSMVLVSGVTANNNDWSGVDVSQYDNLLSMANLSSIVANDNRQWGVNLDQNSVVSIGIVGMPEGFGDVVNGLLDLAGLELPEELLPFFDPAGGIEAHRNQWDGVAGLIEGDLVALGAFFDIHATGNQDWGVEAEVISPFVALGLAGSSQNLAEILQLGQEVAGFFDLDLPLTIPGGGQMVANDNNAGGVSLDVQAGLGALAALVGAETSGNTGIGASVSSQAGALALAAAARLNSTDNDNGNLDLNAMAGGLALGLIADVNASDSSAGYGINANVESEGLAALLTLSTDALRPLAGVLGETFLGEPYDLPGDPWGPVTAHNNFGPGIIANVDGGNLALAAFIDTQANSNDTGFQVDVQSEFGTAAAAFLSTDLIYDFVSDLIGGDPIPGAGLGGIQASGNHTGNGIDLNVDGYDMALALLAGVEANNNLGSGINANLNSDDGGAYSILVGVDANNNLTGDGISLNLRSTFEDAIVGLVYVDADENAGMGIRINAVSDNASAFALLADVDAYRNDDTGINLSLTAADDAAAAITYTYAIDNRGRGLNVDINAGGDASVFAGSTAADDLDAEYNISMGLLGLVYGLVPQGENRFNENDTAGMRANVFSAGGDVQAIVNDVIAMDNGTRGVNLILDAAAGDIDAILANIVASDNDGQGVRLELNGGAGGVGTADALFVGNTIIGSGGSGLFILGNYSGANLTLRGSYNVVANNDNNGVHLQMNNFAAATTVVDFGGGATASAGQNSLYGNGNADFRYNGVPQAFARFNWWGVTPPAPGQVVGNVNAADPLAAPPPPPP